MSEIPVNTIESLKKQYGDVYCVAVPVENEKTVDVYLRRPNLTELDMYTTLQNSGRAISGMQTLAKSLVVGGEKWVIENDYTFMSILPVMDEIFAVKRATIKKL